MNKKLNIDKGYFEKFTDLANNLDEDYNVVQGIVNTDSDFKNSMASSNFFELAMERHRIAELIRDVLLEGDTCE